jgi:hypothetical protein
MNPNTTFLTTDKHVKSKCSNQDLASAVPVLVALVASDQHQPASSGTRHALRCVTCAPAVCMRMKHYRCWGCLCCSWSELPNHGRQMHSRHEQRIPSFTGAKQPGARQPGQRRRAVQTGSAYKNVPPHTAHPNSDCLGVSGTHACHSAKEGDASRHQNHHARVCSQPHAPLPQRPVPAIVPPKSPSLPKMSHPSSFVSSRRCRTSRNSWQ